MLTLCYEEVEGCQAYSVSTKHVVSAGVHAGSAHAQTTHDLQRSLHFNPETPIYLERKRIFHKSDREKDEL